MGNADSMPVVSQVKSLVQVIGGDEEGARRTQENFVREVPVVSQITSAVQAAAGDMEGARQTQEQFAGGLSSSVDGIPVVGHIKGGIHYAAGDNKGGDNAMKSASRTTGVMGGGAVGFVASGGNPVGAIIGGIAGGAALDGITTGVESAINQEYCPNGYVAGVTNMIENPNPGDIFDLALMPVADGIGGYGAGGTVSSVKSGVINKTSPVKIGGDVVKSLIPNYPEKPSTRYPMK